VHPGINNLWSKLNFEAKTMTAFSGFLRCGEFTIQSRKAFDPSIHITRSSMQFMPSIAVPSQFILTVPSSKTDPFRKGVAITITSVQGSRTCTMAALKSVFKHVKWPPKSPLFSQDNSVPMSHSFFISQVK